MRRPFPSPRKKDDDDQKPHQEHMRRATMMVTHVGNQALTNWPKCSVL